MFPKIKQILNKSKYAFLGFSLIASTFITIIPAPAHATTGITNIGHIGGYDTPLLTDASAIALDSSNNMYILNKDNSYLQKYDSSGTYITRWGGFGSGDGQFDEPEGITIDSSNNVYVADTRNNRIQIFNTSGVFQSKWGSSGSGNGEFNRPRRLTTDSSGNIFVADTNNHRVQKFNGSGVYQSQWGSNGSGNGEFSSPEGIAVDSDGNVYVADPNNFRVQKFNASGVYQSQWGSSGNGDGEFTYPRGVAIDDDNNVYITDSDIRRVQKFDASGVYESQFDTSSTLGPKDIAFDSSGNIHLAGRTNDWGVAAKYSSTGDFISSFGQLDNDDGHFGFVYSVAVDSENNVYVVDTINSRIQKFDSNGNFLTKWGTAGSGDGEFGLPLSITIDANDNIYATEMGNSRIQKFDNEGNFLLKWGTQGSGDGQFDGFIAVATGNDDSVYVSDSGNARIQKFDSNGNFLTKWGTAGSGDGEFGGLAFGIATSSDGTVFVADSGNRRIQRFNSSGIYQGQFGSSGTGDGEFDFPAGVTIDPNGNIYVSDLQEDDGPRIQKFNSAGIYQSQYTQGAGEQGFPFYPYGQLTAGPNGRLYVPDLYGFRVEVLCDNDVSDDGCALSSDNDQDNISDDVENAAPNSGDANNDGTLDSEQDNVASFLDPVTGEYAVLQVSEGCSISSVSIDDESASHADTDFSYPVGLMDFTLDCGTPGITATVTQYYYGASGSFVVRKYNPTTKTYTTIDSASVSEQTIGGKPAKVATYQVKDGGSLDLDGAEDGNIHDPAGLATQSGSLASTGQNIHSVVYLATGLLIAGYAIIIYIKGINKHAV